MISTSLLIAATVASLISCCTGYGSGAPTNSEHACSRMTPGHGFDLTPAGDQFILSAVRNGDLITVTLKANTIPTFKGFVIRAFTSDHSTGPVGAFIEGNRIMCDYPEDTVTHSDPREKESFRTMFVVDGNYHGHVDFMATVVVNYDKYYGIFVLNGV